MYTLDLMLALVERPAEHGNGLDELLCLVLPMVILGVAFLVIVRRSDQMDEEPDEADTENTAADGET